jgi:hypothetical protein
MTKFSRTVAAVAAGLLSTSLLLSVPSSAGSQEVQSRALVGCSHTNGWFKPVRAKIPVVTTNFIRVLAVSRNADGTMGAPPLTDAGKKALGWDRRSTPPGYYKGSVPTDAHTWPDGSALGNKMLRRLHVGDRVILFGADGEKLCYRINERHEYPRDQVPERRFFRTWGPPQIAMIVCSGRRLGPGNWLKRTVWFGTPIR